MKQYEIKPQMRYPGIAGVPGWLILYGVVLILFLLFSFVIGLLLARLSWPTYGLFLVVLPPVLVRSFYSRSILSIGEDYVEGPFVGKDTRRILKSKISAVSEVPAKSWALQPEGLMVWQRKPWPGKFIFIPSGVSDYQQIRQQLLEWRP